MSFLYMISHQQIGTFRHLTRPQLRPACLAPGVFISRSCGGSLNPLLERRDRLKHKEKLN